MNVSHFLFVRLPNNKRHAVNVRCIESESLARRLALLLAEFLAQQSDEFACVTRWAFATWDAITAAGMDRRACKVEIVRTVNNGTAKRSRTIARLKVA